MITGKLEDRLASRWERYLRARERPDSGKPEAVSAHVSVVFHGDPERLREAGLERMSVYGPIAYGRIRMGSLERLAGLAEVERISEQSQARPLLDESVPEAKVPPLWSGSPALRGTGVVVGVVDTGIDIFHNCFRKSDDGSDTRILFLWDQTDDTGPNPPGFAYGRHYTADDIKQALAAGKFDQLDSDGHGTHVAGTAAGDGTQSGNCHLSDHFVGVAPDADLIIVKSEFRGQTYVDGVQYIFDRAGSKAAVANLSLGTGSASHDGTSDDELALDAILTPKPPGRAVVVASGNSADEGLHAHRTVGANDTKTMSFEVLAGDRFYTAGYIWYGSSGAIGGPGPGAAARLKVTLKEPGGATKVIEPGDPAIVDEAFAGGRVTMRAALDPERVGRHRTRFQIEPTAGGTLASGTWEISLEETAGTETEVDCWLGPFNYWREEDSIAANGKKELKFFVTDDVTGTSSCRITYTGDARISIKLTTPDPDSTAVVAAGDGNVSHDAGKNHTVRFNSTVDTILLEHQIQFWINAKKAGKNVDKGAWLVSLEETAGHATDYVAVFAEERPWTTVKRPGGSTETLLNQPLFVEADRERSRTVESPAAAQNVIAVGAYNPGDGSLADFSSRGPTVDGRQKPDLCAPGVAITAPKTRVKDSPCVSDCCEDFYVDKQGTSMAAPHVAGAVALMFQRNGTLDFEAVRTALRDTAIAVTGGDPNDWGEGKLNAQAAVMSVAAPPPPPSPSPPPGGGGGGGGGGGSNFRALDPADDFLLPPIASWPHYLPTPARLQELFAALSVAPAGQVAAALVSRHFDEVKAIVNGSKRVAVAWHRMNGPDLLRFALSWTGEPRPLIPATIGGVSLASGFDRLLQVLAPLATPSLRADIETYRPFLLALPGARLSELPPIAGDCHGQ